MTVKLTETQEHALNRALVMKLKGQPFSMRGLRSDSVSKLVKLGFLEHVGKEWDAFGLTKAGEAEARQRFPETVAMAEQSEDLRQRFAYDIPNVFIHTDNTGGFEAEFPSGIKVWRNFGRRYVLHVTDEWGIDRDEAVTLLNHITQAIQLIDRFQAADAPVSEPNGAV